MNKERLNLIVGLILVAAFSRLLPHPSNVAPVAAIALFAGAYLPNARLAFAIPLLAMLLADLIIGFHSTMPFVYVGMLATVCIGMALRDKKNIFTIAGASLVSSVVFFVLTNLGVWMLEGMYPHDMNGLVACYLAALPFFINSLLGDLFFAGLLFGVFSFAEQKFPQLRASAA